MNEYFFYDSKEFFFVLDLPLFSSYWVNLFFFLRWIEANYNLPCIQKYVFKNQVSTNNSILLVLLARTVQAGPATQHRPCKLPDQWYF